MKKGFTLIELLIVIAIIAVLAAVVFVALNPLQRFKETRNVQRWSDVDAIAGAIRLYQNAGSYINTQWIGTESGVKLASGTSGTYTSQIFSASTLSAWTTLYWSPSQPSYKELPNNQASESSYNSGNANMSGNVLLYHLNETSGTITDSSGSGNAGTYNGSLYGQTGKFNRAIGFAGSSDYIDAGNASSLNLSGDFTVEAWVKKLTNPTVSYAGIITKGIGYAKGGSFSLSLHKIRSVYFFVRNANNTGYAASGPYYLGTGWTHLVGVFEANDKVSLYANGVLIDDSPVSWDININNLPVQLGKQNSYFHGSMDEVAIYNRALSPDEVLSHYRRGANRLRFQVRSCADNACSGESFIGPDGTAATYYTELNNSTIGLPALNLTNLADNQYFQYQVNFNTDRAVYSPILKSVTVGIASAGGGRDVLVDSCLDLGSILVSHLPQIPFDPSLGDSNKTYYALQRDETGQVNVQACAAEGEEIKVTR